MRSLLLSRRLVFWLILLAYQWGNEVHGRGFLIRGVSACTKSDISSFKQGTSIGFLVACRDDCVISGQHFNGEDTYALAMRGNQKTFIIETELASGKPFEHSDTRRFKSVIEGRELLEDTFQARLDAAERPSFRYLSLPVTLSSRWLGIQAEQIDQSIKNGAREFSTETGRLSIFDGNEISRIEFRQSADDRYTARENLLLKNYRHPPFGSGLREVRHTYVFSPPRKSGSFSPFQCEARTTFDDGDSIAHVTLQIEVEQFEGPEAANEYIDTFLARLPAGMPVVSSSNVSTVLDKGIQKMAVDYESVEAARLARFLNEGTTNRWLVFFVILGFIAAVGLFAWRRPK